MNNEMPEEIFAVTNVAETEIGNWGLDPTVWVIEPTPYTRTDLTDRRTDVDALIKVAVDVAESLTQLTGMNVDDLYEAVDAVKEKRK